MKNVIDLFTGKSYDQSVEFVAGGLPVFRGNIYFEEHPVQLDFANELVQIAMQLPERSKKSFLDGMDKINDLCEYAVNSGNNELVHKLCELGFLDRGVANAFSTWRPIV